MNNKCPMTNDKKLRRKIIISGIGTGGHYFPALVVAKEFLKQNVEVIFLVRKGYAEEEIAKAHGLKTLTINPKGFYGKSIRQKILSILSIITSIYRLNAITKKVAGVAFGGFGALPLVFSCLINRRPYYLFEPNRIPGRATKFFTRQAKKVFLGLPLITEMVSNYLVTGIPIRREFIESAQKYCRRADLQKKVLFLGGSQGALKLNKLAIELQSLLPKEYQIVIITGKRDYDWVRSKRNGRTDVIPFTLTPWQEIQDADVIITRSGALYGYEVLSSNRPAIFIPFPFAIDNHQYHNAEYFSQSGNAIIIEEKDATKELLAEKIKVMMQRETKTKSEIILDADKRIADVVLKDLK